jgi:Mg2+ and Co2+ transporter CorA
VLTVFVFDERESKQVEDWRAALERLADDELFWFALRAPTEEEVAALQEALELGDENAHRLLEQPSRASLADAGERLHVTLYAAGGEGG